MLSLKSLLLLDTLTMQNGQAELKVADLAIVALTLLL